MNVAVGYVVATGRGKKTKKFGVREEREREKAKGKGKGRHATLTTNKMRKRRRKLKRRLVCFGYQKSPPQRNN